MSRWLAMEGTLFSVTISFPRVRLKTKSERLWERAVAFTERNLKEPIGLELIFVRAATRISERNALLKIPRKYRYKLDPGKSLSIDKWW